MSRHVTLLLTLVLISIAAAGCSSTPAPGAVEQTPIIVDGSNRAEVADEGYDLTSYFGLGKAVKGVPELAVVFNGAKYLFSSEENRSKFLESAEKYIPGYESHCPVSLSKGLDVDGKPTIWRIHKERLYFFADEAAAKEFDDDPEGTLKKAVDNADEILKR